VTIKREVKVVEQKQAKQKQHREIKQWVEKMKTAQQQLNTLLKDNWMDEARRFAQKQGKEVRKLIETDIEKVKSFVERERQDLERLQKQIPTELNRWKKALDSQKKELTQFLGRGSKPKKKTRKATSKKKSVKGAV